MRKLLFTLLCVLTIVIVKAQNADFKPSGNLSGYGFFDYYYMSHADSLGRGAGNVQYKPLSTTSTLMVNLPTTPTITYKRGTTIDSLVNLNNQKTNLLSSGANNNAKSNGFQIRRVYLAYDYNFAPKFTAYTTLADEQNLDAGGNNTVFLKYAYVKWVDIFSKSTLIVGQQPTCSFATNTEQLWGYRSIEKTIMDMHNSDASSDLGVALQGDLWRGMSGDSLKPNLIGYMLQIGNGSSAKPESDGFKNLRWTLYTSLLQQSLSLGYYGDFHTYSIGASQSISTFKVYANYKIKDIFKIGGELFTQSWKNCATYKTGATTTANENINIMGWSVFVSGNIMKKLDFFARLDMYNPDTKYDKNKTYTAITSAPISPSWGSPTVPLKPFSLSGSAVSQSAVFSTQTFYTLGFDYTPVKKLHIMPNIWVDKFSSMVDASKLGSAKLAKSDYDFVPRITVYYVFNK